MTDSSGDPFKEFESPVALGEWLAEQDKEGFATLWEKWRSDVTGVPIELATMDRKLVFTYTGMGVVKPPLKIDVKGDLLEQTYALLTVVQQSVSRLPRETDTGTLVLPTTEPGLIGLPPAKSVRSGLPAESLPSPPGFEPSPIPSPLLDHRIPSVIPLPLPAVDGPVRPGLPEPAAVTAVISASTVSTVRLLPDEAPSAVVPLPASAGPVTVFPTLPTPETQVASATKLPQPERTAAFVRAGRYLLPLEPFPADKGGGKNLADAIKSLDKDLTLPLAVDEVLGHLTVRRGFMVLSRQFKGIVLEVELDDPVQAVIRLAIGKANKTWSFEGEVFLARGAEKPPLIFTLSIHSESQSKWLVMALDGEVNLVDDLFIPMFGDKVSVPKGFSVAVKNPVLVMVKTKQTKNGNPNTKALVSVNLGMDVDFAELPFVGEAIKSQEAAKMTLGVQYASGPFLRDEIAAINSVLSKELQLTAPEGEPFSGLLLSAAIQVTGESYPMSFPLGGGENKAKATSHPNGTLELGGSDQKEKQTKTIKWFKLNRSIGPAYLERVGAGYWDDEVQFRVSANVQVSTLTFSVEGLGGSLPLKLPSQPSFNLDGLGLSLAADPVSISGALLRSSTASGADQYDGMALIKAADFTITGLGSYTTIGKDPSFFIFAVLHKDLGGPAFFHVTGLAAGFGFHRALKLPPIDEVQNFPLVRGAFDETYFAGSKNPVQTALTKLRDYIPSSPGGYWFALGVRFSSFEMIESFVLLAFSFGKEVAISVLGLSRLSIPKGAKKPVAYAELQLKAELNLTTGTLKVEGRLSENSFILDGKCRLAGGFAFYTWFSGSHDGDFVVTIGGYHPRFLKPDHYPVVPRVAIDWPISAELRATGELYFALTPSCLMAGGKLAAVFKSGGLKAWFDAYADFLLQWQPFYYEADVGVNLGVSYTFKIFGCRTTLKVELSADLSLWGPPFAGRAHITWFIISFTVKFGHQERKKPDPLTWAQFEETLLPTNPSLITLRVSAGLISQGTVDGADWPVVNAHQLVLTTSSAAPATTIKLNGTDKYTPENDLDANGIQRKYGVQPMDVRELTSNYDVVLSRLDGGAYTKENVISKVVRQGVPTAMWGPDKPKEGPSSDVIAGAQTGLSFTIKGADPTHELLPVDLKKLAYEDLGKDINWRPDLKAPEPIEAHGSHTLMNTIEIGGSEACRQRILDALQAATPAVRLNTIDLRILSKTADRLYQASPRMACLGQPLEKK
ncbi:hypothetical protein PJI16_16160 [Nitrospira sp. MA-1]|nr:hypothetical protein [Nitrospira sp. MA-1]